MAEQSKGKSPAPAPQSPSPAPQSPGPAQQLPSPRQQATSPALRPSSLAPQSPSPAPQSPPRGSQSPRSSPKEPQTASRDPRSPAQQSPGQSPGPSGLPPGFPPGLSPGLPPGHNFEAIEPLAEGEQDEFDDDSALGSDVASSTASVTSSILRYRTIHGRTFHSERGNAQYWGSNDDQQNEMLDILHHVITLTIGERLVLAPIPDGIQKVVDIGTGTGIWAIDFADEHPDVEVIGTDISPIQPAWVPPNLKFEIEDCSSIWTFDPNSVDFVHIRWLIGSVGDWDDLFQQAYRILKPGGYVESLEPNINVTSDDGSVREGSVQWQWGRVFAEGGKKLGRSFTVVEDDLQKKGIEAAGFVDIEERMFRTPQGGWARDPKLRELGRYQLMAAQQDVEGSIIFITDVLGWSAAEIAVFAAHRRLELKDPNVHGYYYQKAVWARKPE